MTPLRRATDPQGTMAPPDQPLGGLGRTLFRWFVFVALPPLILAGAAGYRNATQSLTIAASNALSTSLAMKQELLEGFFHQQIKALALQTNSTNTILLLEGLRQARHTATQTADPAYHRRSDLHTFTTTYGYSDALLLDLEGNILFRSALPDQEESNLLTGPLAATPFAVASREALARDRVIISDLSTCPGLEQPAIFIIHPVHDAADQQLGLLAVAVSARQLDALGQAPVGLGQTGHTYLVGRDLHLRSQPGFLIPGESQPLIDTELTRLWLNPSAEPPTAPEGLRGTKIHRYPGPQGTEVVGMASNLPGLEKYELHWLLIAEIDKEEAFAAATNLWRISLLLLAMTMVFIATAALAISKRITAPIAVLSNWARQVARGNLSQVQLQPPPHEIGLLYQSFRELVTTLDSVTQVCEAIARGDFSQSVEIKNPDDRFGQAINRMIINLRSVVAQVDAVTMGNYATVITPQSLDDTLGRALHTMTARLRQVNLHDEKMIWFKTGATGLDSRMRGVQDLNLMSRKIISYLTEYIGAEVGIFYLPEGDHCRPIGGFGLTPERVPPLALHEEAIRETIAGKKSRLYPQPSSREGRVPLDLGITSGLPGAILITPLLFERKLTGILVIGGQPPFHPDDLDFLDQVGESIAVTIHSVQAAQQIQELLAASRLQTEQLQAQQETLRLTNEELAAQACLLKQSEEELKIQSEDLQTANEALEEKTVVLSRQKAKIKQSNQELATKARELELANQYKSEFLANISHELRSPLNSLLILAKTLANNEEGNLHPDQVESARIIHQGGLDLLHIINDILDLSKVEAGMIALMITQVTTAALVEPLQQRFQPLARQEGVLFTTRIDDGFPTSLQTDGQRVGQILNNLLANAFKFTAAGTVTLAAHLPATQTRFRRPDLALEQTVAFSVRDTGIGIPAAKQQVIFEAFQQVDGSISREYGGTGLGLTISRQLAALLGGEIQLQSTVGEGSTFTLYLPRNLALAPPLPAATSPTGDAPSFPKPMAGAESGPPLSYRQTASGFLNKPATPEELDHLLAKLSAVPEPGPPRLLAKTKILLVDDDLRNTFALSKLLQPYAREVLIADNGNLALQLLAAEPDIDLVLMDIIMPVLDGLETIRAIRALAPFTQLPIIALTAKALPEDREHCLAAGASEYLAKPVDLEKLLAILQCHRVV